MEPKINNYELTEEEAKEIFDDNEADYFVELAKSEEYDYM